MIADLLPQSSDLSPPNVEAVREIDNRIADILRPPGALARLDQTASWLAGWQGTSTPSVERPHGLIFAADHGVVAEGVSAFPADVTAAMLTAFEASQASVSALASVAGAAITAIDVGVGNPTGNIRVEPALDHDRFTTAFIAGREAVKRLDTDLLILGEMGIGNSTPAAAVSMALVGGAPSDFVGRGTGIDDDRYATKVAVVADACQRIADEAEPLEVLRQVGGAELVAITGAMVEARLRSIPVLLDGYIATSPGLVLHAISPDLISNCRAGHCSAEPGHRLALDHLGLTPLLTLDMRLGEGSGAMAAVPLVKMACALVNDVPTFTEWFSG